MLLWLTLLALAAAPDTVEQVQTAELNRAPAETFAVAISSSDPAVRAAAARALGRLDDPSVGVVLSPLLADSDELVRRRAAEALAIAPGTMDQLVVAWTAHPRPAAVEAARDRVGPLLLFGLGRRGDGTVVDELSAALDLPSPHGVVAAHALGRLGRRKIEGADAALPALLSCVEQPLRPNRAQACAWAIYRIGLSDDPRLLSRVQAVHDVGPVTQTWLIRALAGVQAVDVGEHPSRSVRAAGLGVHSNASEVASALSSADPWLAAAARSVAGQTESTPELLTALLMIADGTDDFAASEAIGALVALGQHPPATALDGAPRRLASWLSGAPKGWLWEGDAPPGVVSTGLAGAVMEREDEIAEWTPAQRNKLDSALARGTDPILWQARVVRAAAEDRASELISIAGVPDGDAAQSALDALAAMESLSDEDKSALTAVLPKLLGHQQVRLRTAARSVIEAHALDVHTVQGADWGLRPTLDATGVVGARIITSRGEIRVRLDPQVAPMATANFAHLADADYYDGVVFHRVVPAFVVQTGCPRGDGWGGPGWTLPDEFSAQPYTAGALGMARSSHDTAGSQWFITTLEQPHLTGDYTWFGEVTSGMHVARGMQAGDTVLDVIIERVP